MGIASPQADKITYAGFVVGDGQADRVIHAKDGPMRIVRNWAAFSIEFSFCIRKTTTALFLAEAAAVEAAFSKPRQALKVELNGSTQYDFSHILGTGFDSVPEIIKNGDAKLDGPLTRNYRVRVDVGMPANTIGSANGSLGVRESTVDVSYSENGRRTISISGVWTGCPSPGNPNAREQFEAVIDTYATAVITAIGGTYELVGRPTEEADDTELTVAGNVGMGRVLRFAREYEEILFSQGPNPTLPGSGTKLDDTRIIRQTLVIARAQTAPGDTPEAVRLVTCSATYDAWIDKGTTSASYNALWDELEPWIITQMRNFLTPKAGAGFALLSSTPRFDLDTGRIGGVLEAVGLGTSGTAIESTVTTENFRKTGKSLTPLWTGNPRAKYPWQGPEINLTTVTQVATVPGDGAGVGLGALTVPADAILVSERETSGNRRIGLGDHTIDVTDLTKQAIIEFYDDPAAAAVAGGHAHPNRGRTIVDSGGGPTRTVVDD